MTPVGPRLRVTWVGHSTVVLDLGGTGPDGTGRVRLLTDPLLGRHAGLLRRRGGPPADAWRGADAVLLSHLHHDHAEPASLRRLPGVPVLAAPSSARWLRDRGLAGVGLGPDDRHAVAPGVEVRLAPARHDHRPMPHRPNAATGHLVRATGPGGAVVVWAVGDTEPFPALAHVAGLAGAPVDVALVPVGGWGPRLSGGHLDPAQAARVCAAAGVRWAVPVHWGTLHAPGGRHLPRGWMDRAGAAFAAAVEREARHAPGLRAAVLAPGGSWDLPGPEGD